MNKSPYLLLILIPLLAACGPTRAPGASDSDWVYNGWACGPENVSGMKVGQQVRLNCKDKPRDHLYFWSYINNPAVKSHAQCKTRMAGSWGKTAFRKKVLAGYIEAENSVRAQADKVLERFIGEGRVMECCILDAKTGQCIKHSQARAEQWRHCFCIVAQGFKDGKKSFQ